MLSEAAGAGTASRRKVMQFMGARSPCSRALPAATADLLEQVDQAGRCAEYKV
jgi:hypothetical protein